MQGSEGLIYLGVLGVAFYLLIIRPQMQRTKQARELLASLEVGDRVVTIGGLHGSIAKLEDSRVVLHAYDGVELTFEKGAIARKEVASDAAPAADGDAKADEG